MLIVLVVLVMLVQLLVLLVVYVCALPVRLRTDNRARVVYIELL
jgi:hypothetical protein